MAPLAYTRTGEGPPLVLINGFAGGKADWDPTFIELLAAANDVILPDNRGMGESPGGDEPFTIADLAGDIAELMRELGLTSANVAGWSMGGFIAQQLTLDHPTLVDRLVLMATDHGGPQAVHADREIWMQLIDLSGTPREQATRLIGLLFPEPLASEIDAQFGEVVAQARATLDPEAVEHQVGAMLGWARGGVRDRLSEVGCPVLVACGELDVVIPAANTPLIAELLPDAKVATYAGAGHAFMAQCAPDVAATLTEFLAP